MPHARFGDVELYHETAGDTGSPVLLVMGLTGRGIGWECQIPALSARHRLAWFDNRGVGETRCAIRPWTMATLAADAAGLIEHLGWDDAHVVGVSMGGMIAQELALTRPERVRSLTLIATHAGGRRPRRPTLPGLAAVLHANVLGGGYDAMARALYPAHYIARADREALRAQLGRGFPPLPRRNALAQLAAVARHRAATRLDAVAAPTLVVQAGRDRLIHPRESDRLFRLIPGARIERFPDAGHGLIRQYAHAVNALLLGHFAEVDQGAASDGISDRVTPGG